MNESSAEPGISQRYRPILELGRGGMATVQLAVTSGKAGFNRLVVIKQIRPEYAEETEIVDLFLDEARLAARLNHPNVVQTHEVGEQEGQPFLVMEYLDGQPFNLARGALREQSWMPLELQLRVLCDVLAGLHHAHELRDFDGTPLRVVHRDVSPHNVFVTYEGQVKVVDFGIAKAISASVQTQQGAIRGKLSYMAPEQARGIPLDRRADIFAVGVMLFEAISGQRFWTGCTEADLFLRLTRGELPSLQAIAPTTPAPLLAVVDRALAFDRAERYANALDMQADLEQHMRSLPAVSPRRLGQFISERFATQRARIREVIEKQLSDLRFSGSTPRLRHQGSFLDVAPESLGAPGSVMASSQPQPSDSVRPAPPAAPPAAASAGAPPGGLRWLPLASLGVAVIGASAAGGAWLMSRLSSAPAPSLTASAPTPPVASSAAALVRPPTVSCPPGMVKVPGGDFYMGHDGDDAIESERPAHPVKLDAFCIDVTEVTVERYRACSDAGQCLRAAREVSWPGITPRDHKIYSPLCNIDDSGRDRHPINCVSWEMADNYCHRQGQRLPTSAEWEFAVRGPDGRIYPWGDDPPDANRLNACGKECVEWGKKNGVLDLVALHQQDDGFPATAPVGSFPKGRSRYGLDDMIGNVMEWVQDRDGPYDKAAQTNPKGPETGSERVVRGGAWSAGHLSWVRPSFRFHMPPEALSHGIGFRCAASLR